MFILFLCLFPFSIIYWHHLPINLPSFVTSHISILSDFGRVFLEIMLYFVLYIIFDKFQIKYNLLLKRNNKYSYFIYLTHYLFIMQHMSILNITNSLMVNIILAFSCSILSGIILLYIYEYTKTLFIFFSKHKNSRI